MKFDTKFWILLAIIAVVMVAACAGVLMSSGKALAKHDGNGYVHNFEDAPPGCTSKARHNWRVAAAELASGPGVVSHPLTDHKGSTYVRPKNRYDTDNNYSGDNDLGNGMVDDPRNPNGPKINGRDHNEDGSIDDGSTARVVGYWVKDQGVNWESADWRSSSSSAISTTTIEVNQSAKACVEQKVWMSWLNGDNGDWQYWYVLSPKVTRH